MDGATMSAPVTAACSERSLSSNSVDGSGTGGRAYIWYADAGPGTEARLLRLHFAICDNACTSTPTPCEASPITCYSGGAAHILGARLKVPCGSETEQVQGGVVTARSLSKWQRVILQDL
jgi:hypothetical protein